MSEAVDRTAGPGSSRVDGGDDAAMIARSLRSPECFGTIFHRHAPAIYRYISRRLGPDGAEDLVAETFLVAFRRRSRYDCGYPDARPWLYGVATRLIRRHRRDEIRFFQAIARTGADPASETLDGQIIDRVAAQAARPDLAVALTRLSQAQRDVLLLVASGLSYPEAGLALGVQRHGPGVRGCAVAASVAVLDHRSPAGWDLRSQWRIDVRRRRSRRWSRSPVPDQG
jgi:RNA polymerase sigma-70 factor (ECF subfamily)